MSHRSAPCARCAPRSSVRRRLVPLGLVAAVAFGVAPTGLATPRAQRVQITSPGGIARRGAVVRVTATDPAGWYCRLQTSNGVGTMAITPIVPTPGGAFTSGWLVPRRTTVRRWALTVACGTSVANVRLGHDVVAHQVGEVLAPVPPSAVTPAIVDITSQIGYQSGNLAAGTGVVIAASGLVITNNHVIAGSTSINAFDLGNHHNYTRVKVVGVDLSHDLAVLQLVGAHDLRRAPFGDSSKMIRGCGVSTVGNVGGTGGAPTITSGIITALNQSVVAVDSSAHVNEHLSGLFQTNALLQPGDSGGPLVDALGAVVGINTAAVVTSALSGAGNQGFAIPFNQVLATARAIISDQAAPGLAIGPDAHTAYLGIQVVQALSGKTNIGVRVVQVVPGSPAARAGLKANDIITAIDPDPDAKPSGSSRRISTPGQLATILNAVHPGASIVLVWTHNSVPVAPSVITLGTGAAR